MLTAKTFSRLVCYQANCFVGLLFCLLLLSSGCVRKRMTFRTNPSGAMVYVDKQPIGLTPVSTNFTYYGTRNIEVVRDGYRTEKFLRLGESCLRLTEETLRVGLTCVSGEHAV
jgi:hypothetical protein